MAPAENGQLRRLSALVYSFASVRNSRHSYSEKTVKSKLRYNIDIDDLSENASARQYSSR